MGKLGLTVLALTAALAIGGAQTAGARSETAAKAYVLTAHLGPTAEVPRPKGAAGGSGTFMATITITGTRGSLAWKLTFGHLTGSAVAAHIHLAAPGKAGPVAIPLCGPCTSPAHGTFNGPLGGNKRLLAALTSGGAYVNVHTKRNPGGEIRGQLENWLSYEPSAKQANLTLVGALGDVNHGFNFDGYAKGALSVSIPTGWKVTVECRNAGAVNHSCAVTKTGPGPVVRPAFSGAASPNPTKGLAKGQSATFSFTTGAPGSYRITCLVPGHELAGMWDNFVVTKSGTPSLSLGP